MIVITTPTGDIGRQVLARILESSAPIRVIARDPSRLSARTRERVEVVEGSHGDAAVVERAFAGADAVFWLVPPAYRCESLEAAYLDFSRPACEALRRHGVQRVVGVSALGRGSELARNAGLVTAALAMDDLLMSSGAAYRSLALPSFMDNMLRQVEPIRSRGVFFTPLSPDRKLPTCATRDIAAVAAGLLLDATWSSQSSVPVLGPEDLSANDMAAILSEVLEKEVRCQQVPIEAFRAGFIDRGASEAVAQGMVDMMTAKNAGLDNAEPRTPESASPTSFRQWCEDVMKPAVLG